MNAWRLEQEAHYLQYNHVLAGGAPHHNGPQYLDHRLPFICRLLGGGIHQLCQELMCLLAARFSIAGVFDIYLYACPLPMTSTLAPHARS